MCVDNNMLFYCLSLTYLDREINLNLDSLLVFQKIDYTEIFHVPYYKNIDKFMKLLGQDPRHKNSTRSMIVIIVATSIVSVTLPTVREIYQSPLENILLLNTITRVNKYYVISQLGNEL